MSAVRLFVANLPLNCSKDALNELFADYGTVENIELKPPKATTDEGKSARNIAFVTIKSNNIEHCIYELNGWKFNGQVIQVTVAKESFLDRLKREREEAATADKSANNLLAENSQLSTPSILNNKINKRKVFNENDADLSDAEDAEDAHLIKKYAARSMQNGKIVIESVHSEPLHIIEAKKTVVKEQLNEKVLNADLKRKQSLKKLLESHKQRQAIVQNALSAVGTCKSKKIVFSDDDEAAAGKAQLFDSDDNEADDDNDIDNLSAKIKHNNNDLYKLQQEMPTSDKRFQVDARFLHEHNGNKSNENAAEDNEKDWQMDILEQVVVEQLGKSIKSAPKATHKQQMVRYDPNAENQANEAKKAKLEKDDDDQHSQDEMFYMVSDTLASSLKQTTDTAFSLLSLCGRASDEVQHERNDMLKQVSKEKVIINNKDWSGKNPFSYDSTDSSDNEETDVVAQKTQTNNKKISAKPKLLSENFFFSSKDERLQEGLKFFSVQKEDVADYEPTRQRLNLVIKQQIHKKQKAMKRPKKYLKIKK